MSAAVGPLPAGQSRGALVAEVRSRLATLPDAAAVVVACSGGPDSSALAHLAAEARPDLVLVLVHVAHGLRERSVDLADRQVVATHASWLGAELVGRDVEVTGDGGIEAAARDARYAALRAVAAERGASAILVGHSADDQAETVVFRLARGTGTDGLAGMSAVAGDLVRPLLRVRRSDVVAFVQGEGLPTAEDAMNHDPAVRRVRIRREVLPTLARIGGDPVGALVRLADLARDDVAALEAATDQLCRALRQVGAVVAIPAELLEGADPALARRIVRRALGRLSAEPADATTVARVLDAPIGSGATLPGGIVLQVERGWRTLVGPEDIAPLEHPVDLDGPALLWRPAGLRLKVLRAADGSPSPRRRGRDDEGQLALSLPGMWQPPSHRVDPRRIAPGTLGARYAVALPAIDQLSVRSFRPGDRIRGPGGTRRVADVLRDAGMPRAIRGRWPLLVAGDRVAWVPGVAADAELTDAGHRLPALALQAAPIARS